MGLGKVLIVDDELNALKVLSAILSSEGFEVVQASNVDEAIKLLHDKSPDAVVTDMKMPGKTGLDLFEYIKINDPDVPVIFLTAYGTVETAVGTLTTGAYHYFIKPPDYRELIRVLGNAVEQGRLKREVRTLRSRVEDQDHSWIVVDHTPEMKRILEVIETVKDSVSSVLVTGETGTGKELIARALHYTSKRHYRPFVAVNCAAIPRDLIEAELFGYEKGAFTGASQRRVGRIESATGGTLFLDEIGELDLATQAKLLRVLQEKEFSRLGDNSSIVVDFRLVASTNRDLRQEIAAGNFREDLFYRINVVSLKVPPLRERHEDIRLLAKTFFDELCYREGKSLILADNVLAALEKYPWPGNVRELRNVIEQVVVLAKQKQVTMSSLPDDMFPERIVFAAPTLSLRELQKRTIKEVLHGCGGNKSKAAQALGISRKTLYKKLEEVTSN